MSSVERGFRYGGPVVLQSHDATWAAEFSNEAERIRATLGDIVVELHHVGSTSIPGIAAKPVIDILALVETLDELDAASPGLASLGFVARGEYGIPGRRYFFKNASSGARTHQIHAFAAGSCEAERMLVFRDYLRANADAATAYEALKRELAARAGNDVEAYAEGKTAFVRDIEARARAKQAPT